MKNINKILLAAAVGFSVACAKESKDDQPADNKDLLVGAWVGTEFGAYEYNTATKDTAFFMELPGGFTADFTAEGNYELILIGDTTKGSYMVDGNLLHMYSEDTVAVEITTLTESELVLDHTEVDGEYTYDSHLEFIKN